MNVIDILLLIGLVYAAARGFRQGAVSQLFAFGGAAAGLIAGALFAPEIANAFIHEPGGNLAIVTLTLLATMVLLGQGIGMALGMRLRHAAHGLGVGGLDRSAGIGVGILGLVLTAWLLAAALVQGPSPTIAQQIRESRVVGAIDQVLPPAPDLVARVGNYLDQQGFPQVFSGLGGTTAPPVDPPSDAAVAAAQEAGAASTVQVQAFGCRGISSGTGFVTQAGFVVTNAHVIAGGTTLSVRDAAGTHEAVAIHFDADLDLAVVSSPAAAAPAITWTDVPAERGTQGATLGYPGAQRQLNVSPATVRARGQAVGRDIYGRGLATRDVLTLTADVRRGDSGGPFVTSDGQVGGVVFAAAIEEPGTGYALTAERVRGPVAEAISRNTPVDTGQCRF